MLRRSGLALSLLLLTSAAAATRARAADEPTSSDAEADAEPVAKTPSQLAAEAHYKRARELYQLGRYREAIAQLEAALKLDPTGAELLYNLALVHEKLGDVDEAVDAYRRYLKVLGPDADPEERNKIEGAIKRLEGAKEELKAREAKQTEHRFTPLSTALMVTGGVALVSTVIVGVMAVSADKGARDFQVGSAGTLADRQAMIDRSKREATIADVLGAITVLSAGAALTLYFTSSYQREDNARDAPKVGFTPLPHGGAVRFEVAF